MTTIVRVATIAKILTSILLVSFLTACGGGGINVSIPTPTDPATTPVEEPATPQHPLPASTPVLVDPTPPVVTKIDPPVPTGKIDQTPLRLSSSAVKLDSNIGTVYNTANVIVYGGSGVGTLSVTADANCTATIGSKDRYGGDTVEIIGAVVTGTCYVTITKAGDINYNPSTAGSDG